ncbi:MAG: RNA 2',3'-cyclic phosphodiesterase [Halanaerobiales bacterium]|nr:RNA 2',3'-cyclic phosphodiesterase [Halanaerobiales bacterium]
MAQIRIFIAIEFSDKLKEEIDQIQLKLKSQLGLLKWVPRTNFHLTLKFLGDVESKRIGEMVEGLTQSVQDIKPFIIGFTQIGGFPKNHAPRVIWLGANEGKDELINLQKIVDKKLTYFGFGEESKKNVYKPHLTLARAREHTDVSTVGRRLSEIQIQPTSTELIQSIQIMKSDLRPKGPVYTCLEKISF